MGVHITGDEYDALLGLDGLEPANKDDEATLDQWEYAYYDCDALAEYHRPGRLLEGVSSSYLIAHDRSVTWGIPGEPQLKTLYIRRDQAAGTFRAETSTHALLCLAQHWLVQRGADPSKLEAVDPTFRPANTATLALEHRIRSHPGPIETSSSCTSDMTMSADRAAGPSRAHKDGLVYIWNTWVVLDTPGTDTVRVLYEDIDYPAGTYTLAEGLFPGSGTFDEWTRDTRQPIPPVPATTPLRSVAAATRSPFIPGLVLPTPPAAPAHRLPTPAPGHEPPRAPGGAHR